MSVPVGQRYKVAAIEVHRGLAIDVEPALAGKHDVKLRVFLIGSDADTPGGSCF